MWLGLDFFFFTTMSSSFADCSATLHLVRRSGSFSVDVDVKDVMVRAYAATGGDGDLDGVPSGLTDVFEVERLVRRLVLTAVDVEGRGVDRHLDAGRPIGVHRPILVVETLQLQLQVRSAQPNSII